MTNSSEAAKKAPPPPTLSRLAAEALIETIDGPVEIVKLVGKTIPVLTRLGDGSLGFRMMREVRQIESDDPLLEVESSDGQTVRVGSDHVFVRVDGSDVRAADLVVGELLEPAWSYPEGYAFPDAPEYAPALRGRPFDRAVLVAAVRPAGSGPLFGSSVSETKSYFLALGARARAQV